MLVCHFYYNIWVLLTFFIFSSCHHKTNSSNLFYRALYIIMITQKEDKERKLLIFISTDAKLFAETKKHRMFICQPFYQNELKFCMMSL